MTIRWFDTLPSTNAYCELLDLDQVEEFTVVAARNQTQGRGQRGNVWLSQPGLNLTFSLVLKPTFLPAAAQFQLTQTLALGVARTLDSMGLAGVAIKWPNDIYVGHSKICGMLTTAKLKGNTLAAAVCGVGLNVNQTTFPPEAGHPTSLQLVTGRRHNTNQVLEHLLHNIEHTYRQLAAGHNSLIHSQYLQRLYRLGQAAPYSVQGRHVTATITGIDPHGHLLLQADGRQLVCDLKEVQFLPL